MTDTREAAARRRKALDICDILWDLGYTADRAEHLPAEDRAIVVRLSCRGDGRASDMTWALVVSTLRVWERTRSADSRKGTGDVVTRLTTAEAAARESASEVAAEAAQQDDDPFDLLPQRPDPFGDFPGAR